MEEKLESIRAWLLLRRRELTADVESGIDELALSSGHHLADLDELASDVDADSSIFEHFRSSGEVLEQIDEALRRIDEGTYFDCGDCGDRIASERLEALPFATQCVECKRRSEQLAGLNP